MYDNALAGVDLFASDPERPDTYLCALPLFHAFGQTVIQNGALAFGGTIVMQPRFEAPATLRLMVRYVRPYGADRNLGVPTACSAHAQTMPSGEVMPARASPMTSPVAGEPDKVLWRLSLVWKPGPGPGETAAGRRPHP